MSQEQNQSVSHPESDPQIEEAINEYVQNAFSEESRPAFLAKMREPAFQREMAETLSDMAMLIAAAAVADDLRFVKIRKRVLFDARNDSPESHAMRTHFLLHRQVVNMEAVLRNDEERKRFAMRMDDFFKDYKEQTSFK